MSAPGAPDGPDVPDVPDAASPGVPTFEDDLVTFLRAGDPYGRLDTFTTERLLRPFIQAGLALALDDEPCGATPYDVERLRTFFLAVAAGVERGLGAVTTVAVDVNHEGFGRVVVYAGRAVLLERVVRDVARFGHPDHASLLGAGTAAVAEALAVAARLKEAVDEPC